MGDAAVSRPPLKTARQRTDGFPVSPLLQIRLAQHGERPDLVRSIMKDCGKPALGFLQPARGKRL